MLVGLTYDLRDGYLQEGYSEEDTAELDQLSTIEAFERTLTRLGYETDRIGHARHLIQRLAAGDRWDIVFMWSTNAPAAQRTNKSGERLSIFHHPRELLFAAPCGISTCRNSVTWTLAHRR